MIELELPPELRKMGNKVIFGNVEGFFERLEDGTYLRVWNELHRKAVNKVLTDEFYNIGGARQYD